MPNNFFRFKQFIVQQDECAMKVCTDACLFGSIVADKINRLFHPFFGAVARGYCLDIGTGTGLLSLMVVQKNNSAKIDAIEIDEKAAKQATENFQSSQWKSNLNIIHDDVKNFQFNKKYDFVFSNPPFFEDDLKSNHPQRNTALHSIDLTLNELIQIIKNNLSENGTFAVLLPYRRTDYFENLCSENNFYCIEKIVVKQTPKHNYFRSILFFSQNKTSFQQKEIIIQIQPNQYSDEFKNLLCDYYLNVDNV